MSISVIRKLEVTPPQNIVILFTGIAAISTLIIYILMLPTEISSYNVFDLEFAWTDTRVHTIFDAWGPDLITQELNRTILDYGFLIAYSTFFAGLTLILTRKLLFGKIQLVGFYLVIASYIAATFDAIENLNLFLMLSSPNDFPSFAPLLASICATIKFGILIIIIFFWILSILWVISKKFLRN
ncbi:MAG: hypothetical protein ACFFC7_30705 [Candidatus Hermodarchaeota archaeon]